MRWDQVNTQTCSIARSLSIFGDSWTLLVIRQVFMRIRRFSDIQQSLGITKHRLSDRLNRLVEEEIIYKHLYDEKYNRFEYKLTERGLELYPILISITMWGDKWTADADGPPVEYVHKNCGENAKPKLSCSHCDEQINANNTTMRLGPGIEKKLMRGEVKETDINLYSRAFQNFNG
ncbi:helix-turn-helix domain-containing protein [Colwellia sp. MB3u-4]|uniref:winged helix-turn-helix transcriptional regulator n=1 Tax=Colwellia sp. MB3u-4 TaxID=2759822 RepID=UPI0015F6BD0B|nr:helix-turn-helix domain-containing protein [Colwellia sp. MB3u-4]MBA6288932.1 helix-turn-helix transcriptional regulator [Colwellia sp. MB3u-4]